MRKCTPLHVVVIGFTQRSMVRVNMGKLLLGLLIVLLASIQPTSAQNCFRQVSAGSNHTVAIKNSGTMWAWGNNDYGQLGDGTIDAKNTPVQIGDEYKWLKVSTSANHNVALKTERSLWAWGYNVYGQLGDGTLSDKKMPVRIGYGTNWVNISAGAYHTLALQSDGTLWAWG